MPSAASGTGRGAAGVRDGDVEVKMASNAVEAIDNQVCTAPAGLAPSAGRPDVVEQVAGATCEADALAQVAKDVVECSL